MSIVFDSDQCAKRLPGLSHTSGDKGTCTACGEVCVTRAGEMGRFLINVDPMPLTVPRISDLECSCWDCSHPSAKPQNIAARIKHKAAHAGFLDYLMAHSEAVL